MSEGVEQTTTEGTIAVVDHVGDGVVKLANINPLLGGFALFCALIVAVLLIEGKFRIFSDRRSNNRRNNGEGERRGDGEREQSPDRGKEQPNDMVLTALSSMNSLGKCIDHFSTEQSRLQEEHTKVLGDLTTVIQNCATQTAQLTDLVKTTLERLPDCSVCNQMASFTTMCNKE